MNKFFEVMDMVQFELLGVTESFNANVNIDIELTSKIVLFYDHFYI